MCLGHQLFSCRLFFSLGNKAFWWRVCIKVEKKVKWQWRVTHKLRCCREEKDYKPKQSMWCWGGKSLGKTWALQWNLTNPFISFPFLFIYICLWKILSGYCPFHYLHDKSSHSSHSLFIFVTHGRFKDSHWKCGKWKENGRKWN